uniref:Uncharacterized protein n=1 Tax=Romanomermis culicivorax TaxID=13658 RepID=A0A915I3P2_ROMCU
MNITVQKLCVNGGDVGEYRRQIKAVVDNCGGCDCFGGSSGYDSRGGHEGHHGHQSKWDCDRCCPGGERRRCMFAIRAVKEGSHRGAAIAR